MKILFVSYGGGHVQALLPVARLAQSRGDAVIFLAMTSAREPAQAAGMDPIGFSDLGMYAAPGAEKYGRQLLVGNTGGPVSAEESVAYLGASYADLVELHGEQEAEQLYSERGRQAFLPVAFFKRMLNEIKPDMVVATSAPRSERAALLAASESGIPSVCVVDLFAQAEIEWVGAPGFASRICVINNPVKLRLLEAGRDEQEVHVTGNPAFDQLTREDFRARAGHIRKTLGWEDRFVVGWASQMEPAKHPFTHAPGDPRLPENIENELLRWVAHSSDGALVVRHHPNEQRSRPAPGPRVLISGQEQPVEVMLHLVDVVVTIASTVGLQGALINKPVITYDASVLSSGAPFSAMGMALGVNSIQEIEPALARIRAGAWRGDAGLAEPGTAARNVLGVMDGLL